MVTDSRTPSRPHQLRPLNQPRPITVLAHNGLPTALITGDRRLNVAHIQDVWRIDDEWWRAPISRRYYQLVLETGALATVYHDLITDAWHEQRY